MADNEIVYEIKADSKKAESAIKDIDASAKAAAGSSGGVGSLTSAIAGIGPAAIAAAAAITTYFVGIAMKEGIAAAIEQENAINRMNGALAIAGRLSAESSQDMIKFSEDIQKTTTVADDAALSYIALSSVYAKNNEQAKQLTMTAINMAAIMGTSVDTAVRQLGATLSGTAGRLSKVVPELDGLTEAQLRAGKGVDLLSSKFSGAAANAAKTFSGEMAKLKNSFGDVLEEVGFFFTKSPALLKTMELLRNKTGEWAVALGILRTNSGDIFNPLIRGAITLVQYFAIAVIPLFDIVNNIFTKIRETIGYAGRALVAFFSGDYGLAMDEAKAGLENAADVSDLWQLHGTNAAVGWLESVKETYAALGGTIAEALPENLAPKITIPVEEIDKDVGIVNMLFGKLGERFKMTEGQVAEFAKKTKTQLAGTFVQGVGNAMSAVGAALVNGGNALTAFGKAMLGMFGQLAQQLGMFYFVLGLATIYNDPGRGAGMIAGGLALMVVGGVLQALAGGGGGGGSSAPSTSGGGGGAAQSAGIVPEVGDQTTALAETPERQRVSTVTVNIEGNVLGDKRTLGLEIADALNEAFGNDGILIARGAIS